MDDESMDNASDGEAQAPSDDTGYTAYDTGSGGGGDLGSPPADLDPCLRRCEDNFKACLDGGTDYNECLGQRSYCYQQCAQGGSGDGGTGDGGTGDGGSSGGEL